MRVQDMHNDAGVVTGFEVWNVGLSRRRACRVAATVPGARVTRAPRLFRSGSDGFCAFEVDGVSFLIIEPFGDNSRYWIVSEKPDPAARPLIERVRSTFAAAWGWP
jgi:hypothetical protein